MAHAIRLVGIEVYAMAGEVADEVTGEVNQLLSVLNKGPLARAKAQEALNLKGQANFRERYLEPALEAELIEMTIPDKPKSSKQKYRLTDKGKALLDSLGKGDNDE